MIPAKAPGMDNSVTSLMPSKVTIIVTHDALNESPSASTAGASQGKFAQSVPLIKDYGIE